jgi:hypothetical protein
MILPGGSELVALLCFLQVFVVGLLLSVGLIAFNRRRHGVLRAVAHMLQFAAVLVVVLWLVASAGVFVSMLSGFPVFPTFLIVLWTAIPALVISALLFAIGSVVHVQIERNELIAGIGAVVQRAVRSRGGEEGG